MSGGTVLLDSESLEEGIAALSEAATTFQLTLFERLSYRVLVTCADTTVVSFLLSATLARWYSLPFPVVRTLFYVSGGVFTGSVLVGTAALAFSVPLFRKTRMQARRLQSLGLASLSTSLWRESRRSHWLRRVRSVLLVIVAAWIATFIATATIVGSVVGIVHRESAIVGLLLLLFYAYLAALLFSARYLQNQRERMDLAARATELTQALEALRRRSGGAAVVHVPSDLLDRAARVEAAQIAQVRQDAVLHSTDARSHGFAIAFDAKAAEQRASLAINDRVELEDLVEQLSTGGAAADIQSRAASVEPFRVTSSSGHIEIAYMPDPTKRRIRVVSVQPSRWAPTDPKA